MQLEMDLHELISLKRASGILVLGIRFGPLTTLGEYMRPGCDVDTVLWVSESPDLALNKPYRSPALLERSTFPCLEISSSV